MGKNREGDLPGRVGESGSLAWDIHLSVTCTDPGFPSSIGRSSGKEMGGGPINDHFLVQIILT